MRHIGDALKLNKRPMGEGGGFNVTLKKDGKTISRTTCINLPFKVPRCWSISDIKATSLYSPSDLPHFLLRPDAEVEQQKNEWKKFMKFLHKYNKAALVDFGKVRFYIRPPNVQINSSDAVVFYRVEKANSPLEEIKPEPIEVVAESKKVASSEFLQKSELRGYVQSAWLASPVFRGSDSLAPAAVATPACLMSEEIGDSFDANIRESDLSTCVFKSPANLKLAHMSGYLHASESLEALSSKSRITMLNQEDRVEKNYARADPSYLKTLGQTHSGWIFGAIAELVDNSRDAKASKLEISIEFLYSKKDAKEIPVLSITDDGHGMLHEEIVRMLSLGRKAPDQDDLGRIGRFGIGFKTGAMRIGQDAIVLTQTSKSRSLAFLSQSLNEGKVNLEIPIVSYCRQGSVMEVDTNVHSEATADYHLKLIKEYSPFNEYLIGEKLAKFRESVTGTQIYIWNLDEWGSDYCLEWQNPKGTTHVGDILIRSRRIRSRPGQITQKVPLDYSLRSYLEVIFLDPRMKIFVQGSLVKSHPLAKSLNKTAVINGDIMGKPVQLTLGRSQQAWEQMNCGIFLYWHGRLIEAYKRVGGMVHNADMGRGVIGVIDVTEVMNDGKRVWVHNDKQGFQDCEAYAKLEEWIGHKTDEYWDNNFDTLQVKKNKANYDRDNDWVQCDKCRKWRMLASGYDSSGLPQEWFCYMPPFNGKCEIPEQQVDPDVITVGAKRSRCDSNQKHESHAEAGKEVKRKQGLDGDSSSQTMEEACPVLKRIRRGSLQVNMKKV